MDVRLTSHAKHRARQRNIKRQEIERAAQNGNRIPTLGGATFVAGRKVRLIMKGELIITAYRPKKR